MCGISRIIRGVWALVGRRTRNGLLQAGMGVTVLRGIRRFAYGAFFRTRLHGC